MCSHTNGISSYFPKQSFCGQLSFGGHHPFSTCKLRIVLSGVEWENYIKAIRENEKRVLYVLLAMVDVGPGTSSDDTPSYSLRQLTPCSLFVRRSEAKGVKIRSVGTTIPICTMYHQTKECPTQIAWERLFPVATSPRRLPVRLSTPSSLSSSSLLLLPLRPLWTH